MRVLLRWTKRLGLAVLACILLLLAPIGYVELACRGEGASDQYDPILPAAHHRPESRTLLTYPEWHIVHAYDDYADVIRTGDPHEFGFLRAVSGFWTSLCALSEQSAQHGGFPSVTKQMVYTIGVSFTAEMLAKATYEETLGRLAALLRGTDRAPLDNLSAEQAARYAAFLQQTPWYKWDFASDAAALSAAGTGSLRDRERHFALGTEYRVKAAYAGLIAQAVSEIGSDALRLRMIVGDLDKSALARFDDVVILSDHPRGIEIETPRYRQLTGLLQKMAVQGAQFIEIAGNDDILLTATSLNPQTGGAIYSFERQGYGDYRHLILVKVSDLAGTLRALPEAGLRLEHIHDY